MEKLKRFFNWFNMMGGNNPKFEDDLLITRVMCEPIPIEHTLKDRAQEIKQKYNHVFETKKINDDFLKDIPDISQLKFKRKK